MLNVAHSGFPIKLGMTLKDSFQTQHQFKQAGMPVLPFIEFILQCISKIMFVLASNSTSVNIVE